MIYSVFGKYSHIYVPTVGTRHFVVESANETVRQDISVKQYIMGTAMP
jgi:hypothetical protein